MQSTYIKFMTEANRAHGFFDLAKHSRIGSLPGQVYQVPYDGLQILDSNRIEYRRATDAEVKDAHDQLLSPFVAVL
jgi:hypothetical protein